MTTSGIAPRLTGAAGTENFVIAGAKVASIAAALPATPLADSVMLAFVHVNGSTLPAFNVVQAGFAYSLVKSITGGATSSAVYVGVPDPAFAPSATCNFNASATHSLQLIEMRGVHKTNPTQVADAILTTGSSAGVTSVADNTGTNYPVSGVTVHGAARSTPNPLQTNSNPPFGSLSAGRYGANLGVGGNTSGGGGASNMGWSSIVWTDIQDGEAINPGSDGGNVHTWATPSFPVDGSGVAIALRKDAVAKSSSDSGTAVLEDSVGGPLETPIGSKDAPSGTIRDNFNRADGPLAGTTTSDGKSSWTASPVLPQTLSITGNQARPADLAPAGYDYTISDQFDGPSFQSLAGHHLRRQNVEFTITVLPANGYGFGFFCGGVYGATTLTEYAWIAVTREQDTLPGGAVVPHAYGYSGVRVGDVNATENFEGVTPVQLAPGDRIRLSWDPVTQLAESFHVTRNARIRKIKYPDANRPSGAVMGLAVLYNSFSTTTPHGGQIDDLVWYEGNTPPGAGWTDVGSATSETATVVVVPQARLELWENGVFRANLGTHDVGADLVISTAWSPSVLLDPKGGGIELRVVSTSPLDVRSIAWDAAYVALVVTPKTDSDTGVGTEAQLVYYAPVNSDTGTGVDQHTALAKTGQESALVSSDAATSVEAQSLTATSSSTEFGTAIELGQVAANPTSSDAATLVDTAYVLARPSSSDAALGTETEQVVMEQITYLLIGDNGQAKAEYAAVTKQPASLRGQDPNVALVQPKVTFDL